MQVALSRVRSDKNPAPRLALVVYLENDEEEFAAREYMAGTRKSLKIGHNDKVTSSSETEEGVAES